MNNNILPGIEILFQSQLGFLVGNYTSDAHIVLDNLMNDYCHKTKMKIRSPTFREASRRPACASRLLGGGAHGLLRRARRPARAAA